AVAQRHGDPVRPGVSAARPPAGRDTRLVGVATGEPTEVAGVHDIASEPSAFAEPAAGADLDGDLQLGGEGSTDVDGCQPYQALIGRPAVVDPQAPAHRVPRGQVADREQSRAAGVV